MYEQYAGGHILLEMEKVFLMGKVVISDSFILPFG